MGGEPKGKSLDIGGRAWISFRDSGPVKNSIPRRRYAAIFNGSSSLNRLTVASILPSAS